MVDSGLHSGLEISESELLSFKRLSADDKVYNQSLRYVALRPRSTWEVQVYLERKKVNPETISVTLDRLADIGMLDDSKVAAAYVHDKQLFRPTSQRKLRLELKKKRIADDIINEVLDGNNNDDLAALSTVIAKKRRQAKYNDNDKLMQYLARQGFAYGDIKQALELELTDEE